MFNAVQFPFIVGFPEESDKSIAATINVALKLNSMHSKFATPIFYFKPYPGTKITDAVINNGYSLPKNIYEWSNFDYIGSSGPWVSEEKYDFFEKFKFYLKLAYSHQNIIYKPLQWLSQFRCKYKYFDLPIEKKIVDLFFKKQHLT